ncbi:amidohydrolase [Actinoplanes sp. SE50]|uniref:amidohydrolase n=1 Tax=unclassified Actinoplanes TaxID=2626549 RepID=UPI00023ED21F|nr:MULTISPECIES: amidohydrolase [unclassified Actinoplanes]AEV83888.1 Putative amidohydrolase ytcJ [Actinoplanes sp. SE50/110]ATO81968.1 amidohydrolase [Actinoplanes sp. SE50]SLL99376.1 amidohydrolase [Actinoplanes sp. SE50/110]
MADLILMADRIHTLTPGIRPTAVAVAGGRITALGDRADVRDWRGPGTRIIDVGTATITPGLVDGHTHPVHGIGLTRGLDLSGVHTLAGLKDALRSASSVCAAPDGWLEGWGLDPDAFKGAPLTAAPLIEVLGPHVPVFLRFFDAHSALVSPRALDIAGPAARSHAGVVRDADGQPTGCLLELEAVETVRAVLPPDPPGTRLRRLRELLTRMAASGLTAANAMDFEEDSLALFRALEDAGDLPMRWRCAPLVTPGADLADIVAKQRLHGRRWQVEGAKFMIDGTVDGGTAWLDEPDSLGESTASIWPDPGEYAAAARHLAGHGVPTVSHAIGDAGIRYALDTVGRLPRQRVPHRIEHLETMPGDLIGRFAALDVTASMQPTHCTHHTRADHTDNWSRRLGKLRADRAFRARDLRDSGARLVLGSDWPIAPFDPRGILAAARLRRPAGAVDTSPVLPAQGLTARMALEGYTSQAAEAAGIGDSGRIAAGCRADFSVFELDPLGVDADEFAESAVVMTVVEGDVLFGGSFAADG